MAIIAQLYSFVIGVDTHAKEHVLSILRCSGELVETKSFRVNSLAAAIRWVSATTGGSRENLWVIEGVATYGATLAAQVVAAGYRVVEAARMNARAHHAVGKTDVLDSQRIAQAVLPLDESRMRLPRAHDGIQAALQVLVTAREQLTTQRTANINYLTALLRQWELGIDARRSLANKQISAVSQWRSRKDEEIGLRTARNDAIRTAKLIESLNIEIADNYKEIAALVQASPAKVLLSEPGIGPITAAVSFCAWSHLGRVRNEDAFKSLAGVNPIPASSGNTTRHRLNRGGDRRLNSALYMATIVREKRDEETRSYILRRTEQGKTRKEIRRCLKTYLARKIFRLLNQAAKEENNLVENHTLTA